MSTLSVLVWVSRASLDDCVPGSSLFSYARTVCALGGRVRMLGLDDILYSHDVPWVILSGQMHIKYRENTHRGPRKKPS